MPEISELSNFIKKNWYEGFYWNGVYVKLYEINTPGYAKIKREFRAIKKLSVKLIVLEKYAMPIITITEYEDKALVVTPSIVANPEWKKNPKEYAELYNLDYTDESLLIKKLNEEDIALIEEMEYPRYIIVNPLKLLDSFIEQSYLLYIPLKKSLPIEVLYKVSASSFDKGAINSFLEENKEPLGDLITANNFTYDWHMQLHYSSLSEEQNTRLKYLFKNSKGPGILTCTYSRDPTTTTKDIMKVAKELELKATQLNHKSLKDFLHCKKLSIRDSWIVLSYLNDPVAKSLLCIDILVRSIKKLAIKMCTQTTYQNAVGIYVCELLILKANPLLLEALFFSRLRVLVASLNLMEDKNKDYLVSNEIIKDIIKSAYKNPSMFLLAIESLLKVEFDKDLIKKVKEDKHKFLERTLPIDKLHTAISKTHSETSIDPLRCSYFILTKIKNPPDRELKEVLWIPSFVNGENIDIDLLKSKKGKNDLERWLKFNVEVFSGLHLYDHILIYSAALLNIIEASSNFNRYFTDIKYDMKDILKCELIVPELLLFMYSLAGIFHECIDSYKEAENEYLIALHIYLKIYGNPKGRGNCVHPWGLLLTYRLKVLYENNAINSNSFTELFDSIKFCSRGNESMMYPFEKNIPLMSNESITQTWLFWLIYYSPMQHLSGTLWTHKETEDILRSIESLPLHNKAPVNKFPKLEGNVYVWGGNNQGQLALSADKVFSPRLCFLLKDKVIYKVACGRNSSFAITVHNAVYAWGNNEFSQLGLGKDAPKIIKQPTRIKNLPKTVIDIACGSKHTLALCDSGKVYSWGDGKRGSLGQNEISISYEPKCIEGIEGIEGVIKIVCGAFHSIVLTKSGDIFGWGEAEAGQLGSPDFSYINIPIQIDAEALKEVKIKDVACGEAHTIVLDFSGKVYGWGLNSLGELGINESKVTTPRHIEALTNVRIAKIMAGPTFSIFITIAGEIYGCGANGFGQIGLEAKVNSDIEVPSHVSDISEISGVSCGENHVIGVSSKQLKLWSWGKHNEGQLGLGKVDKPQLPCVIPELVSIPISSVHLYFQY